MKQKDISRRRRNLLLAGLGVAAAVAVFVILARQGIGIPCLFYTVTGLQCPGCGNSRAALALLRLDLPAALGYNLLFPLEFGYIAWVVFCCARAYWKGKPFAYRTPSIWLDIGVLTAVLAWWVVRNFL